MHFWMVEIRDRSTFIPMFDCSWLVQESTWRLYGSETPKTDVVAKLPRSSNQGTGFS
jgi:hypothetical protein